MFVDLGVNQMTMFGLTWGGGFDHCSESTVAFYLVMNSTDISSWFKDAVASMDVVSATIFPMVQ